MIKSKEFLSGDEVIYLLNISPETLDKLVEDYFLLAVKQKTGDILYPSFQFKDCGIIGDFSSIVQCFKKAKADGWIILQWLFDANDVFDKRSPMDHILEFRDFSQTRMAASVYADTLKL